MQRIIFVNLHGNEFLVKTLNKIVYKQSLAIKHKYLLDYLLNCPDVEVCSYINPVGFSMASQLPKFIMKFLYPLRFLEHKIVLKANGIEKSKITVLRDYKSLTKDDIVILYHYYEKQFFDAEKFPCFKAVSMMHFSGNDKTALVLKNSNVSLLFGECNLKKHSDIFRKNYSWYEKEMLVVPFVYAGRFKRIKPFEMRQNKAFATGTITYRHDEFHISMYGDPCVQPLRKQIKDNSEILNPYIDCSSRDYLEDVNPKHKRLKISIFEKLYIKTHTKQSGYYSFNMVDAFNSYKMSIVGEEVVGQPGIGFVESMACGCAYIGINRGYYEDYGMIPGKHYIPYDGSIRNLIELIAYYQKDENQAALKEIAAQGANFAKRNFIGDVVAEDFVNNLFIARDKWNGVVK